MSRRKQSQVSKDFIWDLLNEQDGRCGVCGAEITRSAALDHDHDTDLDRGLLCITCNIAEGAIKRSGLSVQAFADALIGYLKDPPARRVAQGCWAIGDPKTRKIIDGNFFVLGNAERRCAAHSEALGYECVLVDVKNSKLEAAPRTILHHSHQTVRGASAPFAPSALEEGATAGKRCN